MSCETCQCDFCGTTKTLGMNYLNRSRWDMEPKHIRMLPQCRQQDANYTLCHKCYNKFWPRGEHHYETESEEDSDYEEEEVIKRIEEMCESDEEEEKTKIENMDELQDEIEKEYKKILEATKKIEALKKLQGMVIKKQINFPI